MEAEGFDPYTKFYLDSQATLLSRYSDRDNVFLMNLDLTPARWRSLNISSTVNQRRSMTRIDALERASGGRIYEYTNETSDPEVIDNTWSVIRNQSEYNNWLQDNFTQFLHETSEGLDVIVPTGTTSPERIYSIASTMADLPRGGGRPKLKIASDSRLHNLLDTPSMRNYEDNVEAWQALEESINDDTIAERLEVTVDVYLSPNNQACTP